MEVFDIHEHSRMIDAIEEDEYFELLDQTNFENSMESLDEMVKDGNTTMAA